MSKDKEKRKRVEFDNNVFSASNPNDPRQLYGDKNPNKNPNKESNYGYTTDSNVPGNQYRSYFLTSPPQEKKIAIEEYRKEVKDGTIENYDDGNLKWETAGSNQNPILVLMNKNGTVTQLDKNLLRNTTENERQTLLKAISEFFAKMYGYDGGKKSKTRKNKNVKKRKTIRRRK